MDTRISDPAEPAPYHIGSNSLLFVISGPSGVGKDSVIKGLLEKYPSLAFVVTAASRDPRPDEKHGVDYYFLPREEFERRIEAGDFLEHAVVYGQHKGIPKQQVREALDSGKDVVMRIDVQGAATVRRLVPEAVLVFLTAPSEEDLEQRLRRRGSDSPDQIEKRLATAREEMERLPEFDYVVINRGGKLDQAVDDVLAIVRAERCRTKPRVVIL